MTMNASERQSRNTVRNVLNVLARKVKVRTADCPDSECVARLIWTDEAKVQCSYCGQTFDMVSLRNIETSGAMPLELLSNSFTDIPIECVEINGFSNFECHLISPLLTLYGIDKDGRPRLIKELNAIKKQARSDSKVGTTNIAASLQHSAFSARLLEYARLNEEVFDVSCLADRAFLIEPDRLNQPGYGVDEHAAAYLADTLDLIRRVNLPFRVNNFNEATEVTYVDQLDSPCLAPLVTSGDGQCLAHALSRALVGRELFTHALLTGLHRYIAANWDRLQQACDGFLTTSDAYAVLAECAPSTETQGVDPSWTGPSRMEADAEILGGGLRPVHIFAFANLLKRPIIVLDSLAGIHSKAEYACVYLPTLCEPTECGTQKHGRFVRNGPLCIAWANPARNHFVPLVGLRNRSARFPSFLLSKAFCASPETIGRYLELTELDATVYCSPHATCPCCLQVATRSADCACGWLQTPRVCILGGERMLAASYITKLVHAMREQFLTLHSFDTQFVYALHRMCRQAGDNLNSLMRSLLHGQQSVEHAIDRARRLHLLALRGGDGQKLDKEVLEARALFLRVNEAVQQRAEARREALTKREERRKVQAVRGTLMRRLESLLCERNGLLSDNPFVSDGVSRTLQQLERDAAQSDARTTTDFDAQTALKSIATGWSSQTFHKEELNESNAAERELLRRVREKAPENQQRASVSSAVSAAASSATLSAKRKSEDDRSSPKQTRLENEAQMATKQPTQASTSTNNAMIRLRVVNMASSSESQVLCVTPTTTYSEFVALVETRFGRRLAKLWYAVGVHAQPRLVDVARYEVCGAPIDFEMTRVAFANGERINAEFLDASVAGPISARQNEPSVSIATRQLEETEKKRESTTDASIKMQKDAETIISIWCQLLGSEEAEASVDVSSQPLRSIVLKWLKVCSDHDSQLLKPGGCVFDAIRCAMRTHSDDANFVPTPGIHYRCDALFPDVTFHFVEEVGAFRILSDEAHNEDVTVAATPVPSSTGDTNTPLEQRDDNDVAGSTNVINDFYLDEDDDTMLERLAQASDRT